MYMYTVQHIISQYYEHLKEYYGDMEKLMRYHTRQSIKFGHFFDNDEEIINPDFLDKD